MTPEDAVSLKRDYEDMNEDDLMIEYDFLHIEHMSYMKSMSVILDRKTILLNVLGEKKKKQLEDEREELDRITEEGK